MEMIGKPRVTTVDDTTIAWGELGSGPPLVLLHGLGDSHRTWRRAAPRLAERYRVLMPDLPGHGLSGRPDAPYTLDWYARILAGWIATLELGRVHLAGHSFGGGVAQWMLLDEAAAEGRSVDVDRLALVAAGGLGREVGFGLRLAAFPVLGPLLAPPLMRVGTQLLMRVASSQFADPESEEIDRLAWMNTAPRSGLAFQRTVSGCIDLFGQYRQTWEHIDAVTTLPPLALYWGERDRILPVSHGRSARERVEGASLTTYANCGHFPHLEATARFVDDLTAFLGDVERPRARLAYVAPRPARRRTVTSVTRGFFRRAFANLRRALRELTPTRASREPSREVSSAPRAEHRGTRDASRRENADAPATPPQ